MAIVVEAGPPAAMSRSAGDAAPAGDSQISVADLIECIEKGVKDFTRSSKYGMFFGAFYAVGGGADRLARRSTPATGTSLIR